LLDTSSKELWFVDTAENAEWVRQNSTEWYNAGHDTPTHDFKPNELEVVEINVTIKAEPVDIKIPTTYEFFEARYAKENPGHWEYLKKLMIEAKSDKRPFTYSLYDLRETLALAKLPDKQIKT